MPAGSRAKRIAVLLPSLEGGGAQRRMVELINGFVALRREVDLLVVETVGELGDRLDPAVRVIGVGGPSANKRTIAAAISNHLQQAPPSVLLSGSAAVQPFAVRALARPRPCPLILRADSHPHRTFPWSLIRQRLLEPHRRRQRLRQYGSADLVIAVAEDVAATIRRANAATPVVTILNPVLSETFFASANQPVELPWPDEPGVALILGIGRLAVAKDFPTLLRAFAQLRKSRPARLVILGQGWDHERAALLRLARRLGVDRDFALPGTTDGVASWLKRADVFVSSSLWEGSAGALIEALAMGCPIVATDCVGSARDLLNDEALGILVPPRKPRIMAEAIAAQLDRADGHQRRLLMAAAKPYRVGNRAAEYLAAIDHCLETFTTEQRSG